jgi:hypothetical protein
LEGRNGWPHVPRREVDRGASAARAATPVKVTSVEEKGGQLFIHARRGLHRLQALGTAPRGHRRERRRRVGTAQAGQSRAGGITGWSAAQFNEGTAAWPGSW